MEGTYTGRGKTDMILDAAELQRRFRTLVERLASREEGQDMIEYALLAALISIVVIAIIIALGPYIQNLFQDVINALNSA
ncbi:MAG: hypothetical protein NVSMB22_03550 [Chloroflexota bacterium]